MDNQPIKTNEEYEQALARIAPFFDNVPDTGSAEAVLFNDLAAVISDYETRNGLDSTGFPK